MSDPVPPAARRAVAEHYERRLAEHGATARGMDWKDEASQALRFRMLCAVCDLSGRSVHEVGAGAGHLLDHLREHGIACDYSGSDLSPAMVAAAKQRHPDAGFAVLDPLDGALPRADVVVCSGVFHVKLDAEDEAWWEFVEAMLRRMWSACRVAIAFNLITDQVDFRVPELFYADPERTLAFCRRELSRHVALRHDYPLYEYTVGVRREPLP